MTDMTMRAGLEEYRSRVSILKKGYLQERYRIEQLSRSFLGNKVTRQVTSVDIATYRDQRLAETNPRTKKPISPATVRLELSLLSNYFDIARIEWGICDDNPVKNVRKPKVPPGRDRIVSPREERLILRYCHNHSNSSLYSIVVLGLETAMRQGEILRLRWEHINLRSRIAHLPETKNGSKRDVPLSVKARDALIRLGVQSKGPVFRYTPEGVKSTWRFMMQKLGIEDLHFHDLRHTAITALVQRGNLDVLEVAAISGHKSLSMLKRYTHLSASHLARKLDGQKHKGRQAVIDYLIPYPAAVVERRECVVVRLLDFENVEASARSREEAIRGAKDALMRQILTLIKDAQPVPPPDQYLEDIDEDIVIRIDPLALEAA